MWQLTHPTVKPIVLNLVDIGQGKTTVAQLWQDDIRLINVVDRVNWQDAEANFQFELCETCGLVGCQSQGWVSVRQLGSIVVLLPAFQRIDQATESLKQEYLPPVCLQDGAIWVEQSDYKAFQSLAPFPDFEQLPGLTAWEAAKLLQWEAPQKILGDIYSSPQLPSDLVIASSKGSFLEQVPIFSELLSQLLASDTSVITQIIQPQEQVVSFYLDLAGIPQWNALVYNGESYQLYLAPGYAVSRSQI